MYYTFDDFGRFAGTSAVATARSTLTAPGGLTPDWNWNHFAWVYAPDVLVTPVHAALLPPPAPPVLKPTEFKLCFTSAERIAIYGARATDAVINDALNLLDDPKTTEVDLRLPSNQQLIDYLASKGLVADDRVPDIKAGKFQ